MRYVNSSAFAFCSGMTNISIGDRVTLIGNSVFQYCANLKNIDIPDSVTNIWPGAFSGCSSLTDVSFGSGLVIIGDAAFYKCSSLTSITIPTGVTSIGMGTFSTCNSLSNATISKTVTSIGKNAFSSCANLVSVFFEGNAPTVGSGAFDAANNVVIYYRSGTIGWGSAFGGRPTVLWNKPPTFDEWAKTVGLTAKYPNACGSTDDPDNDGMNNLAEMNAGNDPTNPKSVLTFESTPRPSDLSEADKTLIETNQHQLYFLSVSGNRYTIQGADAINGPWQIDATVDATTTQKRVVLNKLAVQRFYRVMLEWRLNQT